MGWTYGYEWPDAKAVHAELLGSLTRSGYDVLGSAATNYGRVLYAVITKPEQTPVMFVALVGPSGGKYDRMWGYKDMDESMGPYGADDCPLALLALLGPPPNEFAARWRDDVRKFHARRTAAAEIVKTAKKGDKVYTIARPEPYTVAYRQKDSLIGYRFDGAGPFRLRTKHLVRLEAL